MFTRQPEVYSEPEYEIWGGAIAATWDPLQPLTADDLQMRVPTTHFLTLYDIPEEQFNSDVSLWMGDYSICAAHNVDPGSGETLAVARELSSALWLRDSINYCMDGYGPWEMEPPEAGSIILTGAFERLEIRGKCLYAV